MRAGDAQLPREGSYGPLEAVGLGGHNHSTRMMCNLATAAVPAPVVIAWLTPLTGPISGLRGMLQVVEEDDIAPSSDTTRTRRPAKDLGRFDTIEERRVSREVAAGDEKPPGRIDGLVGLRGHRREGLMRMVPGHGENGKERFGVEIWLGSVTHLSGPDLGSP
ncbi:hypothetical protein CFIO01_06722 [Colletotrichum fioriniae PJ7]|uniref:Uncharacterized protein n=1 Tax=Colletotrichum fioriniae PJ7 TaxID=1445577 RepID=A0A010Q5H1_9PEZI|nr:hypothetical protein CFIO01_06722 [Colletotrichum fioriniae PJ7]